MERKKVDVAALETGMYVSALDRPWLDSPFLFQGFLIENDEDLRQLRDTCEYVYIDTAKGKDAPDGPPPVHRRSRHGKASVAPGSRYAPDGAGNGPVMAATEINLHREPSLKKALPEVNRVRRQATVFMDRLMRDVAEGGEVKADEAAHVARDLSKAVSLNVDASMWLNIMRHEHEYTAAHCVNVSVLAVAFAAHLGYEGEALDAIGLGALLHDIGLIRTPKAILEKQGKLDPGEVKALRRHPVEGHRLLAPVSGIPPTALNIIRHHHERLDGSGYPDGLAGQAVPPEALIVAVADMYDAMTSERPYAPSMSPHGTVSVIRRVSPTEFGSDLVDAFMRFIGIYPISTVVELNNHSLGMVVSHTRQSRLKPVLIMLIKPNGEHFEDYPLLDLSQTDDRRHPEEWQILRVVNPGKHGLEVGRITATYLDRMITKDSGGT